MESCHASINILAMAIYLCCALSYSSFRRKVSTRLFTSFTMENDSVDKNSIWFGSVKPQLHSSPASTNSSQSSIPPTRRDELTEAVKDAGADSSTAFCSVSNVTADDDCNCRGESDEVDRNLDVPPLMGRAENKNEDAQRPCFVHLALSSFHREERFQRGEKREWRGTAAENDDRTSIWFDSGKALPRTRSVPSRVLQKIKNESGAGTQSFGFGSSIWRKAVDGSPRKQRCMGRGSSDGRKGKCPGIGCRTMSSFVDAVGNTLPHCNKVSQKLDEAQEEAPIEDEKLRETDKIGEEGNIQASEVKEANDVGGFDGGVWEQFPPAPPDEACRLELLSRAGKTICRLH